MKRFQLAIATLVLSIAVIGCSQQNNPVETQQPAPGKPVSDWQKAAERQGIELVMLPQSAELYRRVSVTKICDPALNTKLRIQYNYNTTTGRNVWMSAELDVVAGALSSRQSLTMMVDDDVLLTDVSLTFGPHGTRFNTPALLNVDAKGLDLSAWPRNAVPELYYYNPQGQGSWERMEADRITVNTNSGQLICVNGKLPHFSMYAFGRRM